MGTNLFAEGRPNPFLIKVQLPREVNSFQELKEVVDSLNEINKRLIPTWFRGWPVERRNKNREVYLINFRVESPPLFTLLADPSWIAVFLSVVIGYREIKTNSVEMAEDIKKLLRNIKGLSEREIELLNIAIGMFLERQAENGEKLSIKSAMAFRKLRQKLLGGEDKLPMIEVKDVEKQKLW